MSRRKFQKLSRALFISHGHFFSNFVTSNTSIFTGKIRGFLSRALFRKMSRANRKFSLGKKNTGSCHWLYLNVPGISQFLICLPGIYEGTDMDKNSHWRNMTVRGRGKSREMIPSDHYCPFAKTENYRHNRFKHGKAAPLPEFPWKQMPVIHIFANYVVTGRHPYIPSGNYVELLYANRF